MLGMEKLLNRAEFQASVFARDNHHCVNCNKAAADAHHLMERRLWPNGGYYLDNGVSLCAGCHLLAEQTALTCTRLRDAAFITSILLPPDFDDEVEYDKWGNPLWPDGTRAKGPLFYDESVQKVLKGVLEQFRDYYKHPRTLHLPWSLNAGNDEDSVHGDDSCFVGREVVASLKMDGEQTSFYRDKYHARALDSGYHSTRTWVGNLWGQIAHEIPYGWRIIGENMFAEHSIAYKGLPTYFFVYAIFNEKNECLSWDDTTEWTELLGLTLVPTIYRGTYDRATIEKLRPEAKWSNDAEGYVLRRADIFSYYDWSNAVGKFVRADHVKTDRHWRHTAVIANQLT